MEILILYLFFETMFCTRCGDHIHYSQATPISVFKDRVFGKYEESKCHPCFIRKYSKAEKIAGGVGHVATVELRLDCCTRWATLLLFARVQNPIEVHTAAINGDIPSSLLDPAVVSMKNGQA